MLACSGHDRTVENDFALAPAYDSPYINSRLQLPSVFGGAEGSREEVLHLT